MTTRPWERPAGIYSVPLDPEEEAIIAKHEADIAAQEAETEAARVRRYFPDDKWRFLDERPEAWLDAAPPQRKYLLHDGGDGVLPQGRVGMLAAAGGTGKSWAITHLALSVATGVPWFGWTVGGGPGAVLLAMAEEEESEIQRRLYHASKEMGLDAESRRLAAVNIMPHALAGQPVALLRSVEETTRGRRDQVEGTDFGTPFSKSLFARLVNSRCTWKLIILDPASRFAGPDAENDSASATRFVQALETLTQVPGNPTVLALHHTNKYSRQQGKGGTATAARGSSALTDGIRFQMNMMPAMVPPVSGEGDHVESTDLVVLNVTKSNYGRIPEPLTLRRSIENPGALSAVSKTVVYSGRV